MQPIHGGVDAKAHLVHKDNQFIDIETLICKETCRDIHKHTYIHIHKYTHPYTHIFKHTRRKRMGEYHPLPLFRVYTGFLFVCIHTNTHACPYKRTNIHMQTNVHTYTHIRIHIHIQTQTQGDDHSVYRAHTYTHTHKYTYIYAHILHKGRKVMRQYTGYAHTHTHTCIHTHTHV